MAKLLKLRRGTTSQHSSFTGAEGEVTVDTTKDTLVVHDGSTAGGVPLAKEAGNIATATEATNITAVANNSTDETVYPTFVDGATGTQGIETDTGFTYNPSSGKLTATEFVGNVDAVDGDFDGTLEADAITVNGTALNEYIADTVGAMVTGNTETGITVTYEDGDNTLDFVVGNSATTTEATNVTVSANNSTDETVYPTFVDGATGTQGIETDTGLTYNPSSGLLTSTSFAGALTGNVTGNASGSSGSCTGNAATATDATNVIAVANNSTDETVYPTFVDGTTGSQGIETDSGLTYNPSTGLLTAVGLTLSGDLTVNGTTTTINSTTLAVDDKNIELGSVDTPSDTTADGGGITLKGASDKEIKWVNSTDSWTFNQAIETTGAIKGASKITSTGSLGVGTHTITSPNSVNRSIHVYNADHSSIILADDQNVWEVVSNNDLTVRDGTDTRVTVNTLGDVAVSGSISTSGGSVSDSKGNLRSIPREVKSSAYTLVAADAGKCIFTDSGVTVPHNVLSTGDAVTIINNSGSDITITQASSLTVHNTADASSGNRTLASRGMATVWFSSGAEAYISGAGLS